MLLLFTVIIKSLKVFYIFVMISSNSVLPKKGECCTKSNEASKKRKKKRTVTVGSHVRLDEIDKQS